MQRIVVNGAGGAGKTVMANRLGRLLSLPVTHLDALRYTDTFQPVAEEELVAAQQAVAATGRLIVDGNSLASMPVRFAAADIAEHGRHDALIEIAIRWQAQRLFTWLGNRPDRTGDGGGR